MSTIIDSIEKEQLRRVPRFAAGDRVRVHFRVVEGNRTRTQVFEGVVIKRQGSGVQESFTVRKQSFGVGVERTFPVHSPKIEKLEIAARGDVRRAKLYYLRDRVGKAARVAERRWGIEEDVLEVEPEGAVDVEGQVQEEVEPEVVPAEEQGDGEPADPEAANAAEPGDSEAPDAGAVDDETGGPTEGDDAAAEGEEPAGGGEDETGEGSEPDAEEASERNG